MSYATLAQAYLGAHHSSSYICYTYIDIDIDIHIYIYIDTHTSEEKGEVQG